MKPRRARRRTPTLHRADLAAKKPRGSRLGEAGAGYQGARVNHCATAQTNRTASITFGNSDW